MNRPQATTAGFRIGDRVAVAIGQWMRGTRSYRSGIVTKVFPSGRYDVRIDGGRLEYRFRPDGRELGGNHHARPMDPIIADSIELDRPVIEAGWSDRGELIGTHPEALAGWPRRVRGSLIRECPEPTGEATTTIEPVRPPSAVEALSTRVAALELERAELLCALEMLASRAHELVVHTPYSLLQNSRVDNTLEGTVFPLIRRLREKAK